MFLLFNLHFNLIMHFYICFSQNDSTLFNNTVMKCCTGLCIDLLEILSSRLGFDYELYEVPDQTWGLLDEVRQCLSIIMKGNSF